MDEIRNTSTNQKTEFSRWNIVRENATRYSEDPKFRYGGKDVSIKEVQNNAAVDTNIYEVIEKYRGDLKMSAEELNQFHIELDETLSEIKSLPDAMKAIQKGEEAWKNLPLDIRKKFGNSINNFLKNGQSYLKEEIKNYNEQIKNYENKITLNQKQNQNIQEVKEQ